jgi:hypothetical protein
MARETGSGDGAQSERSTQELKDVHRATTQLRDALRETSAGTGKAEGRTASLG